MDTPAPLLDEHRLDAVVANWTMECAKRLRARRRELRLNQAALADAVGVRLSSISKFETGQALPRDRVRLALAVALACEVDDIWPPLERAEAWAMARAVA